MFERIQDRKTDLSMNRWLSNSYVHCALILMVWAATCLPNLGKAQLWDIDEGNNAECAYEMMESGNWIVPTFNYQLRVDKPALLYWMQILCYQSFGVNEFSARFPCALGALVSMLALYYLGKTMLGWQTGLLGSISLAGMPAFVGAAHFANPDSLLNASILCTLLAFYLGYQKGTSTWMLWTGITTGVGMLAKGPIAVALPGLMILVFLVWEKQTRRLLSVHLLGSVLLFLLVAAPWYAWVGVETKFEWHRGFFLKHNLGRFGSAMENHGGPWFYYLLVLAVGAAPWSAFAGFIFGDLYNLFQTKQNQPPATISGARFLLVAFLCVVGFFSLSGTKLPNYILPAYGPLALLFASAMVRWNEGKLPLPHWLPKTGFGIVIGIGILVACGLLIASGSLGQISAKMRIIPGVDSMVWIASIPLLAGTLAWTLNTKFGKQAAVLCICIGGIGFSSALGAWNGSHLNQIKAPRKLAELLPKDHLQKEINLGSFEWFQPSAAFYSKREIVTIPSEANLKAFLESPLPTFVFIPSTRWSELESRGSIQGRKVGEAFDFYRNMQVAVVANR